MSYPSFVLFLIRHAEPVPQKESSEENERPLSVAGQRSAERLAEDLAAHKVDAVYASPYPRALQTVEPIARQKGLAVQTLDELRERLLATGLLPNWKEHLSRSFLDFDYRLPGGESANEARDRGFAALEILRARHQGVVVAGSHGNLITLILSALAPGIGFDFWSSMPMPAVYQLEHNGQAWRVVSGPGLEINR